MVWVDTSESYIHILVIELDQSGVTI